MPRLEVRQIREQDVYKDMIRVNESHRTDRQGLKIKEGKICRIVVDGKVSCRAILRGNLDGETPHILMDEFARNALGLELREIHDFEFAICSVWGQIRWAWYATDMGYQIAARLGIIGFLLGLFGSVAGIVALFR